MKNMKKAAALVLVLALALTLVTVFADPAQTSNGVVGDSTGTALDKSIKIAKSLKAYNPDALAINAPTITYSYTVAAVTGGDTDGKTITDSAGLSTKTKTPPSTLPTLNGETTGTIAWTPTDQLNASLAGTANSKYLTVDFSAVAYNATGVYRYAITETIAASTYTATGVTDGTAGATGDSRTETLYLDVYVRDPQGTETGFQIYGYVLASGNTDQPQTTSNKLDAFTTDEYRTTNVTVSKTLVNDSAMNGHGFPFHIAFTNATVSANVKLKKAVGTGTASDMASAQALSSTTDYVTIANGGQVKYIGIPLGTTASAYETNNVTGTTYSATGAVSPSGTAAAVKTVTPGIDRGTYTEYEEKAYNSNLASVDMTALENYTEAFTNTLVLISPTGYVARMAPYALMLVGGILMLLIARRHRKHADRDE